ncbi:MAG: xanthine dehydrogenase family protein subunit M [bacterium]
MMNLEYCKPASLLEAVAILKSNRASKAFAGGTDILVRWRQGLISPTLLVDLKNIPELREITPIGAHGLRLGAGVTLTELIENDAIRRNCPLLSQAAMTMACVQVRNRATLGGNLVNASPSADTAPSLMVLDAELEVYDGVECRQVPIQSFFTGPGTTQMKHGEILTAILIPEAPRRGCYLKHTLRRAMDIAGVSVCLSKLEGSNPDPRLVLGAVAPTPIRVPQAEALLAAGKVKEAGEAAAEASKPIDDVRASAEYRRAVIPPLVARAYHLVFETP